MHLVGSQQVSLLWALLTETKDNRSRAHKIQVNTFRGDEKGHLRLHAGGHQKPFKIQ
jgi:hypothetical protein